MKKDLADKFYIDEAIHKIDTNNDPFDAFVYSMQAAHHSNIEKYIKDKLDEKVFPKIWGKPTKFSFWWRGVSIERDDLSAYKTRILIKQFGKVRANEIISLKLT